MVDYSTNKPAEAETCVSAKPSDIQLKTPHDLLSEAWDKKIPIDPVKIAKMYGIPVYIMDFDDKETSGVLEWHNDAPRILVNRNDSLPRKRFTVAHELGHLFRGHLQSDEDHQIIDDQRIFRSGSWDKREQQANTFAANLLMPSEALKAMVLQGYKFVELAKKFGVSEQAMFLRLQKLRII